MLYATFQCEIVIQFQDFKYSTESAGPRDPQEEDDMVCACWVCCVVCLVFGLRSAVGVLGCGSCLLYTSPSPRDKRQSRMPSSA